MNLPFGSRLRRVLVTRPRPSDRLDLPAAHGATDAELARLGDNRTTDDLGRRQAMALLYGSRRPD